MDAEFGAWRAGSALRFFLLGDHGQSHFLALCLGSPNCKKTVMNWLISFLVFSNSLYELL